MKTSIKLGVAGFVLSAMLAWYLESNSGAPEEAQAIDPAVDKELRQMGRELGAAVRPEAMFKRLSGAGSWLRNNSPNLKPRAARAADADTRKRGRNVRTAKPKYSFARKSGTPMPSSGSKTPQQTAGPRMASAPYGVSPAPPSFYETAPNRSLGFRLHRFLVGQQLLAAGVIDEAVLKAEESHGKYLVYLELSVTNQDERRGCRFTHEDLRLQGSKGLVYTPIRPRDGLRAYLEAGQTHRGGVAFAVYNDSAPARLLYRTGPESFDPLPENFFARRYPPGISQSDSVSSTSDGHGEHRRGQGAVRTRGVQRG